MVINHYLCCAGHPENRFDLEVQSWALEREASNPKDGVAYRLWSKVPCLFYVKFSGISSGRSGMLALLSEVSSQSIWQGPTVGYKSANFHLSLGICSKSESVQPHLLLLSNFMDIFCRCRNWTL